MLHCCVGMSRRERAVGYVCVVCHTVVYECVVETAVG